MPENPTKDGYVFLGWFDENGKPVLSGFKIKENVKLTAKWAEENQELVKITFDTDGGSNIADLQIIKGEKLKLPENPTKDGFIFKNWVDVNNNLIYDDVVIEEDTVLKAVWEENQDKDENDRKKDNKKDESNKAVQQNQEQNRSEENNNNNNNHILL